MSPRASTALKTDMYELTMVEAAVRSGTAERRSVFEVFNRRLPPRRRYGVVAGVGRLLDALGDFTFGPAELDYLHREQIVSEETIDRLREYRFTGDVVGYPEGEVFFPGSPIVVVEGTFLEAVVIETLVLSILNHDSAVAAAASRMATAAHGRPLLEMGARRTHEDAAVAAARAAVVGGFSATSVLEAGRRYGITAIGTAAHSFTLLHDSEEEAFAAQVDALGPGTTLLVDTYDVERGVELAVAAARAAGGELGAVRLDSGDLVAQAFTVRAQLDALGATTTRITVTSDLDEYAIAALNAAPVDSYGVGTKLVTGSGHPTAELVYKLVSRVGADGRPHEVAKRSTSKKSVGGLKRAGRIVDGAGRAVEELVVSGTSSEQVWAEVDRQGARRLMVDLVVGGEPVAEHHGPGALGAARERHAEARAALPYPAWRLSEGEPAIPTRHVDVDASDDT
ncbi:nicotinate phosphoribosyltransferase [Georgenia sp. Z1491]|uniref:nicotinate phosphoribosyltransferase n=1 Tax=Georgenia sp. Z1491 TaxID=3416707 RepID=UPI003CF61632